MSDELHFEPDEDLQDLIHAADLDGLVRMIDNRCASRDWEGLLRVRDRSRSAVKSGRQLWPAATLAEYRIALLAPPPFVGIVLDEADGLAGRFTTGPLTEVAAQHHTWIDLEGEVGRAHTLRSSLMSGRFEARSSTIPSSLPSSTSRPKYRAGNPSTRSPHTQTTVPSFRPPTCPMPGKTSRRLPMPNASTTRSNSPSVNSSSHGPAAQMGGLRSSVSKVTSEQPLVHLASAVHGLLHSSQPRHLPGWPGPVPAAARTDDDAERQAAGSGLGGLLAHSVTSSTTGRSTLTKSVKCSTSWNGSAGTHSNQRSVGHCSWRLRTKPKGSPGPSAPATPPELATVHVAPGTT